MGKIYLNIDGRDVAGFEGQTILDIARENDIAIPSLCHDERVKMYGSCGVCLVEAEGNPRLLRACSTVATNGMVIVTESEKARAARKTALELLLSDHTGDCRPPCALACPAETDCQGYLGLIANGAYDEAFELIKEKIPLPGSIGRVCPHPCETACRRQLVEEPINIAALKTFAAESHKGKRSSEKPAKDTGKSIAVIGGGPGGLSAAYFLRLKGHSVTIYDAMPQMGGMLRYGIPEYRLPKAELQYEIDAIEELGITMKNNIRIGSDISLDYLRKEFDAVIVAVGAWSSTALRCPGEELQGVYGGIDFLRMVALNQPVFTGANVAVVGGGNTAMDACRTLVRLGASKVYNIYRRTQGEMPAQPEEIHEAQEEGVLFKNLRNPLEIIGGEGHVTAVRLQVMTLGEPDASGRRAPVALEGQEELLEVDTVIAAIGQRLDGTGLDSLSLTKWKTIETDDTFRTNLEGVFAIGDGVNNGADIAISAIGHARKAAQGVDCYLSGESFPASPAFLSKTNPTAEYFSDRVKSPRKEPPLRDACLRKGDFLEIRKAFTGDDARSEASRCLECGCMDYFNCKLLDLAGRYDAAPERFTGETHRRTAEDNHPYIRRNPDKCILCGLCARACEEVTGETVYGLVGRGFDTIVSPAGNGLLDAGCISCGLCVDVCPTGALTEVTPFIKQVPLREKITATTCGMCGAGCQQRVASKGAALLRALPDHRDGGTDLLCVQGRFAFHHMQGKERLIRPMIRLDGILTPVSYQEAIVYTEKRLQGLQSRYGLDSIAVTISDSYTNEEIQSIKDYARNVLQTEQIYSFAKTDSGIGKVLGRECSTAGLKELQQADCILLAESNLRDRQITVGTVIRKALKSGTKLITLNIDGSPLDTLADLNLPLSDDLLALRQMVEAAASPVFGEADPAKGAKMLSMAKRAVIVFEQDALSHDAGVLLAELAVYCGLTKKPGSGVLRLTRGANTQGLIDLGVGSYNELQEGCATGSIKGLFVFGEEIPKSFHALPTFLAVMDTTLTETAQKADALFPAMGIGEKDGHFTGTTGKLLPVRASIPCPLEMDHSALLAALSR